MQHFLTRVLAVLLALQPWSFGVLAAPRPKNAASSLSSPIQDQAVLESLRSLAQVQNTTLELGLAPITARLEAAVYVVVSGVQIANTQTPQDDRLARFSRWNE